MNNIVGWLFHFFAPPNYRKALEEYHKVACEAKGRQFENDVKSIVDLYANGEPRKQRKSGERTR